MLRVASFGFKAAIWNAKPETRNKNNLQNDKLIGSQFHSNKLIHCKFNRRIPEVFFKIDDLIIKHEDSFGLE